MRGQLSESYHAISRDPNLYTQSACGLCVSRFTQISPSFAPWTLPWGIYAGNHERMLLTQGIPAVSCKVLVLIAELGLNLNRSNNCQFIVQECQIEYLVGLVDMETLKPCGQIRHLPLFSSRHQCCQSHQQLFLPQRFHGCLEVVFSDAFASEESLRLGCDGQSNVTLSSEPNIMCNTSGPSAQTAAQATKTTKQKHTKHNMATYGHICEAQATHASKVIN